MADYRLTAPDKIHLTTHSGVRFQVDDPRLDQLDLHALPMAVAETRDDGFVPLRGEPTLSWRREPDDAALVLSAETLEVGDGCDSLEQAAEPLRAALAKQLGAPAPGADRVRRAITLDLWLADGRIAHTYEDAIRLIRELAEWDLADHTLLYLPGWNAPYDTGYPKYQPARELGGMTEFSRLLEVARRHGLVAMPHLNFWGYDTTTGLLPAYDKIQLHDGDGNPRGWPGLLRCGATNPLAYMRVEDDRWQNAFFGYVGPLIDELGIEALFLDELGSHGDAAQLAGTREMLDRLRRHNDQLLLGGEVVNPDILGQLGVLQSWGMPWCGLEQDLTDAVSPLLGYLLADRVTLISHLGLPASVPCRYCWTNYPWLVEHGREASFEAAQNHRRQIGGVPHVRLDYARAGLDVESLNILRKE